MELDGNMVGWHARLRSRDNLAKLRDFANARVAMFAIVPDRARKVMWGALQHGQGGFKGRRGLERSSRDQGWGRRGGRGMGARGREHVARGVGVTGSPGRARVALRGRVGLWADNMPGYVVDGALRGQGQGSLAAVRASRRPGRRRQFGR